MTALTLFIGAVLLGAGPTSSDLGPEGKIVDARNGKVVFAGLGDAEVIGVADPTDGFNRPWDSEGQSLNDEAAREFTKGRAAFSSPPTPDLKGYYYRVVVTKGGPKSGIAGSTIQAEPGQEVRQVKSGGNGAYGVAYILIPKKLRTIDATVFFYDPKGASTTVAWCRLDGRSTHKGISLRRTTSSEMGKDFFTTFTISLPDIGKRRQIRFLDCNVKDFPENAEWFPQAALGPGIRLLNVSLRSAFPETERGVCVKTQPRTTARFKIAVNPKW